jgi:hypothetical protein
VAQSSPWEQFKTLPQFQGHDDRAIASHLYQAMNREQAAQRALRQYQQIMPVTQEYLANRPQFEKWLESQKQAAQQAAPQQAAPAKQGWWNPPAVRDSYRRYLSRDESGREVIHPDAPLDARHALMEYQQYKADFANKFLTNPEEAIGPMIEERAAQKAQELIEQTFQARENEAFVSDFEEKNRDWLLDSETGSVSPTGVLFHKYVDEARSLGINGPKPRAAYATAMIERDLLVQKYEQERQPQPPQSVPQPAPQQEVAQPPQQVQAQQNMQYLRREASRNPSRSAGAASLDPRQPKPKQTFEQMLLAAASEKSLLSEA